jgi:hypothetical protein
VNPVSAARVDDPADVFDEDAPGLGLGDDPAGIRPEVALIGGASLAPGLAVRLARDASK